MKARAFNDLVDTNDNDQVRCYECKKMVDIDDCKAIMLDDNGPGEQGSLEGYVCQSCCDQAEADMHQ